MSAEQERQLFATRSNEAIKPEDDKVLIRTKDPQMLRAIDALKGVMIYAQQNGNKAESIKK
jgi:hypothetical protein